MLPIVNLVGTKFVARSELFVISIELAILAVFVVLGLTKADPGRFAEAGTHAELLAKGGLYARFWERQSGGFIDCTAAAEAAE